MDQIHSLVYGKGNSHALAHWGVPRTFRAYCNKCRLLFQPWNCGGTAANCGHKMDHWRKNLLNGDACFYFYQAPGAPAVLVLVLVARACLGDTSTTTPPSTGDRNVFRETHSKASEYRPSVGAPVEASSVPRRSKSHGYYDLHQGYDKVSLCKWHEYYY